jgi:hypothetical protein
LMLTWVLVPSKSAFTASAIASSDASFSTIVSVGLA